VARYRKIDVRIYNDARFRQLSAPSPNGQSLFLYLLTNQFTTAIPGLYRAGAAQLAEDLGWPVEAFLKAFREVSAQGLARADWRACLLWIPNVVRYDPPQSPNAVRSWRVPWDELPECSLKHKAYQELERHLGGLTQALRKAFHEVCPKGLATQEQEQEQEEEGLGARSAADFPDGFASGPAPDRPAAIPAGETIFEARTGMILMPEIEHSPAAPTRRRADPEAFERFWVAYPRKTAKGAARKAWAHLAPDPALQAAIAAALDWQRLSDAWLRDGGQYVPYPASYLRAARWEDERSPLDGLSTVEAQNMAVAHRLIARMQSAPEEAPDDAE
jgi:hypothetical protein